MKFLKKTLVLALILCLVCTAASAATFTDAHGNVIELDETLEAYTETVLHGADDAARKAETNLGDLWADALRWFAVSGAINEYFEEDDVTAGNTAVDADAGHIVALWNGGNLRADIAEGKFGAEQLAEVLPYPNKVAVVYMTGAQLLEALEAASQALPCTEESAAACASFMQVSGIRYTVDTAVAYDKGEAYGDKWFKAASLGRVTIEEVNGQPFDAEAVYAVITSNANFNGMDSSYVFKAASLGRVTIEEVNGQPFDAEAVYAVITSNANFNGMDSSYVFKTAAEENEKSAITTAVVRDVIWLYVAGELNNVVGEAYAEAQGRITVR